MLEIPLTTTAENLRDEIRALLSDAGTVKNHNTGDKIYVSDDLTKRVRALANELVMAKVPDPFF